jgi:hypothetical protein
MRGRPEDLDAARRQLYDKDRVDRDQSTPRPHFGCEEIRGRDFTPVRPEERLPRRRTFRCWWNPMRLENPRNCGPSNVVTEVLERTLDPRVPHVEFSFAIRSTNWRMSARTPWRRVRLVAYVHFRAMSWRCQRRSVSGHDRRDLAQRAATQPVGPRRESPSVVIGESQAPRPHLASQHTILFDQVRQHLPLPVIQPAGHGEEQHSDGRDVDHKRKLTLRRRFWSAERGRPQRGTLRGNPGHSQGAAYGLPRQFPTLPGFCATCSNAFNSSKASQLGAGTAIICSGQHVAGSSIHVGISTLRSFRSSPRPHRHTDWPRLMNTS